MSLELIGWHDEYDLDDRRRLRNAMLFSLALHGSIFAAFAVTPARSVAPMPQVLAIELVAAPPTAARASRPRPAPAPAQTPPPAPPVVKAPVQVLPEETPGRILKAKPKPEPAIRRPRKEKVLSYEEAMADALDATILLSVPTLAIRDAGVVLGALIAERSAPVRIETDLLGPDGLLTELKKHPSHFRAFRGSSRPI